MALDPATGLERFVEAQAPVYATVCAELAAGAKRTHWMWFIFPQLRGLGRSAMASYYGLDGRAEALAYLQHPLLGARLKQCTEIVLQVHGRSAHQIFGSPDDLKFVSCLTLFDAVAPQEAVFARALERYADNARDPRTMALLDQIDAD